MITLNMNYIVTGRPIICLLAIVILLLPSIPVFAEASVLRDVEGNERSINDYLKKGKWLVVMIWASDCFICNKEAKHYVDLHNRRKNKDLDILGLSIDGWSNKADAIQFIKRHNITFPNLIGENVYVSELYTKLSGQFLAGTPAFLVFDQNGELLAVQIGAVPVSNIEEFIKNHTQKTKNRNE